MAGSWQVKEVLVYNRYVIKVKMYGIIVVHLDWFYFIWYIDVLICSVLHAWCFLLRR